MKKKRKRSAKETGISAAYAERQRHALALRIGGASYDVIASKLGYANRGGAYKAVGSALAEITREPAEELRTLELERLDALYRHASRAVEARMEEGNIDGVKVQLDAIRTATRLLERRAKMLGLDAPTKVDANLVDTSGMTPDAARSLLLGAMAFAKKKAGLS